MMVSPERLVVLPLLGVLALALGCGSPAAPLAEAPTYEPPDQAKCRVVKDHDEPLIIEWPAAERANLEALSKRGAVVVRYQGCDMQVLTRCHVARPYAYTPTTPQHERVTIRNEDDLYARLPLGAVRLASELERTGELVVSMTIVGTYGSDGQAISEGELEGECTGATHIVNAMTVGAFEFYTGAAARVGAGVDAVVAGGGARSETERTTLNRGGDRAACAQATGEDESPPYGCGALLRVEVARIAPTPPPTAAPAPTAVAEQPPGGSLEPGVGAEPPVTPEPTDPSASLSANPAPTGEQPEPAVSGPRTADGSSSLPPPAAPDQTDGGDMVWVYVGVGVVAAALATGIVIGAVTKANEEDEETYQPQPGDLGDETLMLRLPVIQW